MADPINVKIDGAKLLRRKLERMPKSVQKAANSAITRSARAMADYMRDSIKQSSGSYIFYPQSHWSSPPGTAPNEWTGALRRSIKVSKRASLSRGAFAEVTVSSPYAAYLEFGTRHMEPRPFIGPAFRAVRPFAVKHIRDKVKAAERQVAAAGGR